ncbi:hypothetical protein O0L34_g10521 [Tuta absoluta]|nr:hypothetical protein O0L34_g10521 [Tuta absoluta]
MKIALVLIFSIIGHKCDTISDIKADLLLRGSGEEIAPKDIESPILKGIEPDKTIKDDEKKVIETKDEETVTTTEVPSTVIEENHDFKEELYTTMTMDTTEYNNVDKVENGADSTSNNDINETTPLSTLPTRAAEEIEGTGAGVAKLDEDHDMSPRVPKLSDNPEPMQQDRRSYEMKPAFLPSASKSATLKGWLQDTWLRPPAGFLVPLRPMALSRALAVWNDLTVEGLNVTDIVVVGYDSNGVNWRSRHNLQPTSNGAGQKTVSEALSKLLLKYQDVNTDANSDGTMRALTSAAKLVPYDSALFVVTDKGAGDAQKLPLALRALVEKRLKVYTIWTDPAYPSEESELQLQGLRNISKHTEGGVLPYSLQVMDMEPKIEMPLQRWEALESPQTRRGKAHDHDFTEEDKFDTLLVRRGGGEAISLGVSVENGVSSLRILIEGLVEHAVLYPPNDAPQVDLLNETSVQAFSPQSSTDGLSPRDVHLVFPNASRIEGDTLSVLPMTPSASEGPLPTVGVWHLSVRCDTCDYRLCVAARTHIHFRASTNDDSLNLRVVGPVASVRETVLIDEYGAELATLPFKSEPQIATEGQELPQETSSTELVVDVPLPTVKGSRVYAKIVGRDIRGQPFTRLSGPLPHPEIRLGRSASIAFPDSSNDLEEAEEYNSRAYGRLEESSSSVQPFNNPSLVDQRRNTNTRVELGLSTKLYGAPGDILQLHFEVTNLNENTLIYDFQAVGELKFLRGINPLRQNLVSGQTVNVIVTVGITETAQPGARDLITFSAIHNSIERGSASTYVYVTGSGQSLNDVWSPVVRHNFQGSCIGRQGSDCAQYIWSTTVIARDQNSGLLRLTSSPTGLIVNQNFIAGSREEVTATYRATCCAPRMVVTAVDAFGNANSYIIDISNYFTKAGVAAIVLAVLLFVALVVLIGLFIYWCVRRRKESRELPYSTSTSRNIN